MGNKSTNLKNRNTGLVRNLWWFNFSSMVYLILDLSSLVLLIAHEVKLLMMKVIVRLDRDRLA